MYLTLPKYSHKQCNVSDLRDIFSGTVEYFGKVKNILKEHQNVS